MPVMRSICAAIGSIAGNSIAAVSLWLIAPLRCWGRHRRRPSPNTIYTGGTWWPCAWSPSTLPHNKAIFNSSWSAHRQYYATINTGAEIELGLEKMPGVEIPYTKKFVVKSKCMSCTSTDDENQGNQDYASQRKSSSFLLN